MADEKEKILKDILSELKSLRQDLYKIQRDMKTLEHIFSVPLPSSFKVLV